MNIDMECEEVIKREITRPDSEYDCLTVIIDINREWIKFKWCTSFKNRSTSISSIFVPKTCSVSTTASTFTLSPQTQITEKLKLAPSEFYQVSYYKFS